MKSIRLESKDWVDIGRQMHNLLEFKLMIEAALNDGIKKKDLAAAVGMSVNEFDRYCGALIWCGATAHNFVEETIQRLHREALTKRERLEARLKLVTGYTHAQGHYHVSKTQV